MNPQDLARANEKTHVLYKTGDADAPAVIKDGNGDVVLQLCRRCGAGEAELADETCIARMLRRSVERFNAMNPLGKAMELARQKRSWVIGEMMLGNERLTREQAIEAYTKLIPEGLLLQELERRMEGDAPSVGERAKHYGSGRQPWDDIVELGWAPAFAAGNVLKYVRRAAAKNGEDDLRKARWYYHELKKMRDHEQAAHDDILEVTGSHPPTDPAGAMAAMNKLSVLLTSDEMRLAQGV